MLAVGLAVYNGRYAETIAEHGDLLSDCPGEQHNSELLGWLAESLAMAGRPDDAIRLASSVLSRLMDTSKDRLLHEAAMATMSKLAPSPLGRWKECLGMLSVPVRFGQGSAYDGSASEFAEGCLLTYAGRRTETPGNLVPAQPATSQLRVRDRHQMLPLVETTSLSGK